MTKELDNFTKILILLIMNYQSSNIGGKGS